MKPSLRGQIKVLHKTIDETHNNEYGRGYISAISNVLDLLDTYGDFTVEREAQLTERERLWRMVSKAFDLEFSKQCKAVGAAEWTDAAIYEARADVYTEIMRWISALDDR